LVEHSDRKPAAVSSVRAQLSSLAVVAMPAVASGMVAAANLVEVAALVGDTARATMLAALMGGQSLTGGELAIEAHVSPSTASEHLAKLVAARLVVVTKKRRFHYYRIASPLVANMLESIKAVAAIEVPPRYQPRSARDAALHFARTCYDHIAGHLGVAIADALTANGHIALNAEGGELTPTGQKLLARLGADLSPASCGGRTFLRPCLDWSERRYHLAGHVGAEICRRCLDLRWFERERGTRILRLTAVGRRGLHQTLGVDVGSPPPTKAWRQPSHG
jgi:DNA-binding transcriptional ArsR family regulator